MTYRTLVREELRKSKARLESLVGVIQADRTAPKAEGMELNEVLGKGRDSKS